MPELPETMRTAEALHRLIAGKQLLGYQINERSRYYKNPLKGLEHFIPGLRLQSVIARRKRIIFSFYDEVYKRNIFLTSFLGMEGHFLQYPGNHSGFILIMGQFKQFKNVRLRIVEKIIYYDDTRHQGILTVCPNQEALNDVFKHTGPDYIYDGVTFMDYYTKLRDKKTLDKQICWWMMEQKFFSGVGNYLKSEILYKCRIAPYRLLRNLSDDDIKNLYYHTNQTIRDSYAAYGRTLATYVDPDGNLGTYKCLVYGETYDPNGYVVIRETFDDKRTSHWCKELQN